ncbi:MAG: diguanylate cyclase [Gammaproteobacteria bacterium]|nr:diguanylate cyclase [Gammaproteobacteria bacterium]
MKDLKPLENEKFERIREIYVESFPEKIQDLRQCWADLNSTQEYIEPLSTLRVLVHKIAGSSGSHDFDDIHVLAKKVEEKIVEILDEKATWVKDKQITGNLVQQLVDMLENQLLNYNFSDEEEDKIPRLDALQLSHRELVIFIVSHRSVELSLLSNLLETRGFTVIAFSTIERAQAMAQTVAPSIVVLDLGDANQIKLNKKTKDAFEAVENQLPAFVVISRRDDVETRKMAAKFEAEAFFATPINAHNFSSTLDVVLESRGSNGCRVLLIDKDKKRISYIEKALLCENIKCRSISMIDGIVDELVNFKPDLILIAHDKDDSYWRDGARIIRLHESHFNMPIIFLMEDEDNQAKLEALHAGADDCIFGHELQNEQFLILKQRILRFRRANHLIIMDSLTGALNRDAFLERANEEISLSIRRKESICLAMIDVDHFKQINDENGHVVGDYVLRHISDYLNNRLRRSDVVGRYAGDEFLVLLPDTDLDSAYLVLDMIRKNLVAHNIKVNNADVRVSISLGLIAARPTEPLDIETLIVEADKKLYEAKVAGRNMLVAGIA